MYHGVGLALGVIVNVTIRVAVSQTLSCSNVFWTVDVIFIKIVVLLVYALFF